MPKHPDFVRVHIESTDKDATVSRAHATSAGLPILDEPAVDAFGRPLPVSRHGGRRVKPRTSVDEEAAKSKPARKAAAKSDGEAVEPAQEAN